MAADAEFIADRSRLRRKLTFWRVAAVAVLLVAVLAAGFLLAGPGRFGAVRPQIARISVSGAIVGDRQVTELFRRVAASPLVSGVVVSISSPGGTTTGSEALFDAVRDLAGRKPTVAFVDGLAASGGYIAALGADRIVARETALVGSIGVLFQFPDASGLLDKIGVAVDSVKSAPLKAEPSGVRPITPEARAALQSVVDDTNAWFRNLVQTRRAMTEAELASVTDGRVFSARQGLPLKLVDQLGTERDAVRWLERERQVPPNLPVRDWRPAGRGGFPLWSAVAFGADLAGFDTLATAIRRAGSATDMVKLDGLLAVWQPLGD